MGSSTYDTYKDDINESGRVKFIILSFHGTREVTDCEERCIITKEFVQRKGTYNKIIPGGHSFYNCVVVKDKSGNIFSVKCDDPRYLSGKLVPIATSMVIVKDIDGNKYQLSIDDPRYLSGEFVGITKGLVMVKDIDGNTLQVHIDDPRYLSGELVHVSKDTIVVNDKYGNRSCVSIDDPLYLCGKLTHINKGKVCVKDNEGNIYQVDMNDPRIDSCEFVGIMKGSWGWKKKIIINSITMNVNEWAKYYNTKCRLLKAYLDEHNIEYTI